MRATQTLRITPMTFQKLPAQTPADHPVVLVKDVPRAVAKVREPTYRHAIDRFDRRFQGLTGLSWCQTSNRVHHLAMAFSSREAKRATERVTEKVKTLLSAVDDVCLLAVQRQTRFTNEAFDFLKSCLGLVLTTTQDHEVVGITNHLIAKFGHSMIQFVEVQIRENDSLIGT